MVTEIMMDESEDPFYRENDFTGFSTFTSFFGVITIIPFLVGGADIYTYPITFCISISLIVLTFLPGIIYEICKRIYGQEVVLDKLSKLGFWIDKC